MMLMNVYAKMYIHGPNRTDTESNVEFRNTTDKSFSCLWNSTNSTPEANLLTMEKSRVNSESADC